MLEVRVTKQLTVDASDEVQGHTVEKVHSTPVLMRCQLHGANTEQWKELSRTLVAADTNLFYFTHRGDTLLQGIFRVTIP